MVCIQFNESKSWNFSIYNSRKHFTYIANWYITIKSVSCVTVPGITTDSKLNFKKHINYKKSILKTIYPTKTKKISNIRKSQNLSLFNDKEPICLLLVNLNVLLKNTYEGSLKGTINIKLYKWCITITLLDMIISQLWIITWRLIKGIFAVPSHWKI